MMTMMHSSLWIGAARGSRRCYIPVPSLSFSTYKEEKLAAKELRRQRYEAKIARLERVRTRRDGRPMDVKKAEFTSWYDKRRTYHEVMDRKARQKEKEWKIEVAAVVERLPLVRPDLDPWEADYTELRKHLDQFTWDYPSELMQSRKSDDDEEDDGGEITVVLPRETEADATNDITTTNRRLKTRIYFVEDAPDVSPQQWKFPTVQLEDGESLAGAAMRLAKEKLGDEVELLALSNCPIAVELDVEEEGEFFGTKTFFMKLQYFRGDVKPSTGGASYGWLDRTELMENAESSEGINAGKFYRYML